MSTTIATVTLDAESQLASVLADPAIDQVYVLQNGRRFRLVLESVAEGEQATLPGDNNDSVRNDAPTFAVSERSDFVPQIELADPDDPWKNYDPEKVLAAFRAIEGLLTREEADAWIADVYAAREAGSRATNRP